MKGIVVDTALLYVREERNLNSPSVVVVQEGSEVDIDHIYVDPDWYRIETQTNCTGWALRKFIAIKE